MVRCHAGGNLAQAFSPHSVFRFVTWDVAPGWFEDAPLALMEVTRLSVPFEVNSTPVAECAPPRHQQSPLHLLPITPFESPGRGIGGQTLVGHL